MAKRPLGLSKSNKAKRAKRDQDKAGAGTSNVSSANNSKEGTPQLTLEVEEGEDPEDELVQLRAMWKRYFHEERQSEPLLNGVINECNGLLIKSDQDGTELDTEYLAIFAFALVESIYTEDGYHPEMHELFERALEVLDRGFKQNPKDKLLGLTYANLCFTRIITEYMSQLKPDSNESEKQWAIETLLKDAMSKFSIYNEDMKMTYAVLTELNTLLELVGHFNSSNAVAEDGLDSDVEEDVEDLDEGEEEDDDKIGSIAETHPLYPLRLRSRDHFEWGREQLVELYKALPTDDDIKFKREVATMIGELYLKKAAAPTRKFLRLRYDNDEEEEETDTAMCQEAQQGAIKAIASALEYLRDAQDPDSTDSWVAVAEAYIDLGNVCDNESCEQDNAYGEAEKLLRKANIAAHGKYDEVLSKFVQDQQAE
ncbi:similar to Saccharomyces cerevisiae YOR051C ETT1 Nuclear protein that inhibits replication of Brome mosaic virus in Saccharomyces cerevisiae [Maudiozyma barnettii]|uniref:Enhancer of translation termination 1 n=1 Tax=Maudiozyma barnettii TaxID=61262 RepID=A0A8H2ZLN0_9SACH|nr:Ett1p [Kazachstania barnettii]CAB4256282.1 similar to Saccharomyces cerevisiae YOR051C ETT1 Nuclear protein that inhibits replication of Brome mosaic virus in Saccharomyces cerevisiae [Kazachstania barnettii]CAD1784891.1 similar to Saccharomyces cerevisiae YOR051C ETT1 Nuclear protein that inhibits replication of Brome mosaic virus in Saccharomyces cerevisiae [Kazachstania barnettii]